MAKHALTLSLTERQRSALDSLAADEDLSPEVYATEVLVKHLYHTYQPADSQPAGTKTPRNPDDH